MTDTPSNPNEIERDLAQTRARLDATIDALQQRLSPGEMVDQAIGYVKESGGGEFGRNLMLSVRDHPIPVALIGVGVAWLMLAAADKPFPYFGFHIPAPVAIDPDFAKQLKYWHETLGSTGYWLIGLHAAAGLFHHYWVRDNTLVRMLPGRTE